VNSLHDLGGMSGFGDVRPTPQDGPAFHSDSERRIFGVAMALVISRWCDADGFRFAIESLPAEFYVRECFPANWLAGLETQLRETGLLPAGFLDAVMRGARPPLPSPGAPPSLIPDREETPTPGRFRVGDCVRVRNMNPTGHTRLPRYLRGQAGTVIAERGTFDFPDCLAARTARRPQALYTVAFSARAIWGEQAGPNDSLTADLYDDYIQEIME
jgi:nitrile hydratase beta subunit